MRAADVLVKLPSHWATRSAWIQRDSLSNAIRSWDWGEIRSLTSSMAIWLRELGASVGDRIVNLGKNSLEWAILDLACSALNLIHVPIDPRYSHSQRKDCIDTIEPKLIFADSPSSYPDRETLTVSLIHHQSVTSSELSAWLAEYSPDDPSCILFTSGTSGGVRGVVLSHKNVMSNAAAKLEAMPQSHLDHRLNFLPFAHAYAYTCELKTWLLSGSCLETTEGIAGMLSNMKRANPTLINGVPLFFDRVREEWERLGGTGPALRSILGENLRRLASGGAPLGGTLRKQFAQSGHPVFQGYGLTEASPVVCSNRAANSSLQQSDELLEVGPPVAGVRVRIDENSRLWVSGDNVMLGYWKNDELTRTRVREGWLDTGDLAEFVHDQSGADTSIRILGRADDTIVLSSGYKIQPLPIERLVQEESWVEQCLLIGNHRPFPIILVQLAFPESDATDDERLARIATRLLGVPEFARPRKVLCTSDAWDHASGLANFKGGLLRDKIALHYLDRLDRLYSA